MPLRHVWKGRQAPVKQAITGDITLLLGGPPGDGLVGAEQGGLIVSVLDGVVQSVSAIRHQVGNIASTLDGVVQSAMGRVPYVAAVVDTLGGVITEADARAQIVGATVMSLGDGVIQFVTAGEQGAIVAVVLGSPIQTLAGSATQPPSTSPDDWSRSGFSSNATFTLSNLHVAATGSGQGWAGTRLLTSGKFYFELGSFSNIFNNGTGIYIADSAWNGAGGGSALGWNALGSNGLGNIAREVAVDIDNRRIWGRINGGSWNGNGSANPATNVGGVDISGFSNVGTNGVRALWYMGSGGAGSEANTANFGATSFLQAVPSGFSSGWLS